MIIMLGLLLSSLLRTIPPMNKLSSNYLKKILFFLKATRFLSIRKTKKGEKSMEQKDFYDCVREKNDPENFNEVEQLLADDPKTEKISKGTIFHLKTFTRHNKKGLFVSRNLAAIFAPGFWILYRRMYLWWAIIHLVPSVSFLYIKEGSTATIATITFIIQIVFGLFANSLFYMNVERRKKKDLTSRPSADLVFYYVLIALVISLGYYIKEFFQIVSRYNT